MADKTIPGSYISPGMFSQAGTGIDPNVFAPGELARYIYRASRRADKICKQTLYATQDTVQLLEDRSPEGYSIDLTDGLLKFFPKRFPIRQVVSLTQQFSSSDAPGPITSSWIHIESMAGRWGWVEGTWFTYRHQMPPMYLVLVYQSGWLATTLSAPSDNGGPGGVGRLTLTPQPGQSNVIGVVAGQQIEIQDANPEIATVASVSGNVVTCTAPLATATHAADTFVVEESFDEYSFADVQQATINLTSFFIKQKGIAPLVLKDERVEPARGGGRNAPDYGLYDEAVDLLLPFTVQW